MKEAIFYRLYRHFKSPERERYVPVFEFMGEVHCPEVKRWGFVSFEVSARLSEIFKENPGLIERKLIYGKSGNTYYGYRIGPNPDPALFKDQKLYDFYQVIKPKLSSITLGGGVEVPVVA